MCGEYGGAIFSLGIGLKVWRFGDFFERLGAGLIQYFGVVVIWGRILEFGNFDVLGCVLYISGELRVQNWCSLHGPVPSTTTLRSLFCQVLLRGGGYILFNRDLEGFIEVQRGWVGETMPVLHLSPTSTMTLRFI